MINPETDLGHISESEMFEVARVDASSENDRMVSADWPEGERSVYADTVTMQGLSREVTIATEALHTKEHDPNRWNVHRARERSR